MSQYIFNLTDPSKPSFAVAAYTTNGYITPTSTTLDLRAISANTSIILYGAGTTEYGNVIQGNMLHILENFANPLEPQESLEGQLWYNNNTSEMMVRNGLPHDGNPANVSNRWAVLQSSTITGNLDMGGNSITNLSSPINPLDGANMQYVDVQSAAVQLNVSTHTSDDSVHLTPSQNILLDGLAATLNALELNALDDIRLIDGSVQVQLDDRISKSGNPDTNNTMTSAVNITFSGGGEVVGLPLIPSATAATAKEYVDSSITHSRILSAFSNISIGHKAFPSTLGAVSPLITSIAYNPLYETSVAVVDSNGGILDTMLVRKLSDNTNTWRSDSAPITNTGVLSVAPVTYGPANLSFCAAGRGGKIWTSPSPVPLVGDLSWVDESPAGAISTIEDIIDVQVSKTQPLIMAISSPTYLYVATNTGTPVWTRVSMPLPFLKSNLDAVMYNVAIVVAPVAGVVVYQADKLISPEIFTPSTAMPSTTFIPRDISYSSADDIYYICGHDTSTSTGEIWSLSGDLLTWALVFTSSSTNTTILNILVTPVAISAVVHNTNTNTVFIVSSMDGVQWVESRPGINNTQPIMELPLPAVPPLDVRFGLVDVGFAGSIDFDTYRGVLMIGATCHQYSHATDVGTVLESLSI